MAKKFNPFRKVNSQYGAPMGRPCIRLGSSPSPKEALFITPAKGDGYYDKGGAYWGTSSEGLVWAVHNASGDFCQYVRAWSSNKAFAKAMDMEETKA